MPWITYSDESMFDNLLALRNQSSFWEVENNLMLFSTSYSAEQKGEGQNGAPGGVMQGAGKGLGLWGVQSFWDFMFGKKEKDEERNPFPIPKRMDLSHSEGKGIGYAFGYTRFDLLLAPDYKKGSFLPMIDLSGLRFDDGKYASNVGFIGRYIPKSFCEVFGANIYYDYRQGTVKHYHQLGFGLEVIGNRWDIRANASIPFSEKEHKKKCVFDDYIGPYRATKTKDLFAGHIYNAELGYQFINSSIFLLYAAAGPYYFSGEFGVKAFGGRGRLRPQFKDYIALDLSYSHDNVFGSIYQAEIIFSLPLYNWNSVKKQKESRCIYDNRIYLPVERFRVIPLSQDCCWQSNF